MPRKTEREVSAETILKCYFSTTKNLHEAAAELGISRTKLLDLIKLYRLKAKTRWRSGAQNSNSRDHPACIYDRDWVKSELKTKTCSQIARELNISRSTVACRIRDMGLNSPDRSTAAKKWYKKVYPNGRRGAEAANWRGGRRFLGRGRTSYVMIYKPDHPKATKDGYVMEHRLIMEKKLGRHLKGDEVVHHKNGNKQDNRLENLELHTRGSHMREHLTLTNKVNDLKNKVAEYERRFGKLDT